MVERDVAQRTVRGARAFEAGHVTAATSQRSSSAVHDSASENDASVTPLAARGIGAYGRGRWDMQMDETPILTGFGDSASPAISYAETAPRYPGAHLPEFSLPVK